MKRRTITAGLAAGALTAAMVVPATLAGAEPTEPAGDELAGKTVFLDPGHQGSTEGHDLNKQVSDGRDGTKACATTGAQTADGVAEHTINYEIAVLTKGILEALGADVQMSRDDDESWAGCLDDRAEKANESGADVAVSIHADSTSEGADEDRHGFHLIVPTLPLPNSAADKAQSEGGRTASKLMRDAYEANGFTPANYGGFDKGISERGDIAGPALTEVPLVFVEMGNTSNPGDAKKLTSTEGQYEHATALVSGIVAYLFADGYHEGAYEDLTVEKTPAPATPRTGAVDGDRPSGAKAEGDVTERQSEVFERADEVGDLFAQLTELEGLDSVLELIMTGEFDPVSDLATELIALIGPLVSKAIAD